MSCNSSAGVDLIPDGSRHSLNEQQLDVEQILLEAQHRWLRPVEICEILQNHRKFHIASEPPNKPPSGSLFIFDRKVLRHCRKDGHNWKKIRDGKTVKEARQRLTAENNHVLQCIYAHGEENASFHRRTYWMLEKAFKHSVLVHYLDVKLPSPTLMGRKEGGKDEVASLPDVTEEDKVKVKNVERDTPMEEVPAVASLSMVPPRSNSTATCRPTNWGGRSRGLGQLIKKAGAKVSASKRVRMESSFEPQQENVEIIDIEFNDEEIGSSQGRVTPPVGASTFREFTPGEQGQTSYGESASEKFKQGPIPPEHTFVPPFPMDSRQSYYCSLDKACGVISNTMTPVDQAFIRNVKYEELCASTQSLSLRLAHSNHELVRRGMEIHLHEISRLQRIIARKEEENHELKSNLEELQTKHAELAAQSLKFELRCNSLERDKVELLAASTHKGKTIKELEEKAGSAISSYQESEDFMEVKVHSFLEGFWYGEAEARAYYPDYTLDFGNFTLPDIVAETIASTQARDARGRGDGGNEALGQDANDQGEGRDEIR